MNFGSTGANISRNINVISEKNVIGFLTKNADKGDKIFYVTRRTLELIREGSRIKIDDNDLGKIISTNRIASTIKTSIPCDSNLFIGSKIKIY